MKNLRNLGIKRVVAILLAASMVLGSTNAFPVYAQEETSDLVIETWGGYKDNGYEYVVAKYNEETTFGVNVTSETEDINYQWYYRKFDDEPDMYKLIDGAVKSSYTVKANEDTRGYYWCEVIDGTEEKDYDYANGFLHGGSFELKVETDLIITNPDNKVTIKYGKEAILTVNATSKKADINYQWYYWDNDAREYKKNEEAIEKSYTVTGNENTIGKYKCIVKDGIETKEAYFDLTVNIKLTLDYEARVTAQYGEEVTLTVDASSKEENISYQWYEYDKDNKDCIAIPGATQSSYTTMVDKNKYKGQKYVCKVTDGIDEKEATICLDVENSHLSIANSQNDVTAKYGEKVTFTVEASSKAGTISYQWYYRDKEYNDVLIEGAIESSYTITADENADYRKKTYYCEVTSGQHNTTVTFRLKVEDSELTIADYEKFVTAKYGEKVTLMVNATSKSETISYRWYYQDDEYNDVLIEGATESSYTITADENAGRRYTCEVTDGIEKKDIYFWLTVNSSLEIADYEEFVTAKYGEEVTFTLEASSEAGTISYQWYYMDDDYEDDYVEIKGATRNSYTVRADENTRGKYKCRVTDGIYTEDRYFLLTVEPVEIADCTISLPYTSATYTGDALKPDVTVKYGTKILQSGTDYTVSYENNINAGTASIVITGTNRYKYTGTTTKSFTIKAVPISKATVALSTTSCNYDGKAKKPKVKSVKLGNQTLKLGTDYNVSYKNNTNIGTASVIINGIGNYTGTATKKFTIKAKKGTTFASDSCKYKITSSTEVAFTGLKSTKSTKVIMPKTVKYGGQKFKVTSVADKALSKNTKVTSITIGSNVKTIGASAFEGCKKLSEVTIGSNVTTLGNKAFKGCTALKSITVPGKVTTIGKEAFQSCSKLSSITIKSAKLKKVDKNALKGIKSTAKIKVPTKKLKAYKKLLKDKGQGKKVKIVK